jgi:hypothetical protein
MHSSGCEALGLADLAVGVEYQTVHCRSVLSANPPLGPYEILASKLHGSPYGFVRNDESKNPLLKRSV